MREHRMRADARPLINGGYMKLRLILAMVPVLLSGLLCGCWSTSEVLEPADITLKELEDRMAKATDPEGRYASARSLIMRQELTTRRPWENTVVQMVETKFMRPDYFKTTVYDDNQPSSAFISNGESSWVVDFKMKKVRVMDEKAFRQLKAMSDITKPGSRLSQIFSNVSVKLCRIGDERFYKLDCSNSPDSTLSIYVDADDYQTERIVVTGKLGFKYESSLRGYGLYEGVRIPEETVVRSGDGEQVSKVIYYKMNSPIDVSEFRPPVF